MSEVFLCIIRGVIIVNKFEVRLLPSSHLNIQHVYSYFSYILNMFFYCSYLTCLFKDFRYCYRYHERMRLTRSYDNVIVFVTLSYVLTVSNAHVAVNKQWRAVTVLFCTKIPGLQVNIYHVINAIFAALWTATKQRTGW